MEPFRLRMKIGAHEFEAEGDQDTVERQFALWRELIATTPTVSASPPPPPVAYEDLPDPSIPRPIGDVIQGNSQDPTGLDRIFHRAGNTISLTVLPQGDNRAADAAVLLLYGHRVFNGLDQVGGMALLAGLQQSGYPATRVDRVVDRHVPELVLRTGTHRAVRYRLNNPGLNRARELARELIAMVP